MLFIRYFRRIVLCYRSIIRIPEGNSSSSPQCDPKAIFFLPGERQQQQKYKGADEGFHQLLLSVGFKSENSKSAI
jgi:hypothetical protein